MMHAQRMARAGSFCPLDTDLSGKSGNRNVWSAASPQAKCMVRRLAASEMYGPPPRRKRNVWSAASPQAKFEDATSWSAQMYTAFVGVDHSWPGWNALRSLLH